MIKRLEEFLDDVEAFVLLFGSYANDTAGSMSDLDIGIYFKHRVDLKSLGFLSATLEAKLDKKIYLIVLNKIEKKDPLFASNILQNHRVLKINDENIYINFKTAVQLSYLEHKDLIDQSMQDLHSRIHNNHFAKRDHAS